MQHIVLVEDEKTLLEGITMNLELEGYRVTPINNGRMAIEKMEVIERADLVILDVMLPEISGIDVCRKIRERSNVPVLFLSAKGTTADKIVGLKNGGTDYLAKPFDLEELLLRVHILIERNSSETLSDEAKIGEWSINFKTYEMQHILTAESHMLTKKEIDLLQLLYSKKNEVVSREEILNRVWGADQFPTSRTVDNFILNLRKILEKDSKHPEFIHSIRGVGYKLAL